MNCENCQWFEDAWGKGDSRGLCLYNPPVVLGEVVKGFDGTNTRTYYPRVVKDFRCSQWEARSDYS